MENQLDILNKIEKVDAPHFLYTRILSRIQNKVKETVPLNWAIAAGTCMIFLIMININVIKLNKQEKTTDLTDVFALKTNNDLYNE